MARGRLQRIGAVATALRVLGSRPPRLGREALGGLGMLATLLGAAPAAGQMPIEQKIAEALGSLPASFVGDPCADCPPIRHQLDLYPDQAFVLRESTISGTTRGAGDPDVAVDEIGSFLLSDDRTLVLMGGRNAPLRFRVEAPDQLRMLDPQGQEAAPQPSYALTRSRSFAPVEPQFVARGMYSYLADAGRFEECLSRWRLPVAQEAENATLERAYLAARRQPGEALLVELEAQIALRPTMDGDAEALALVPLRFIGVWPGETCGARFDTAPLENSYWKLTRLGDGPVRVGARQREPHLILRPDTARLAGFGGCNRLLGGYRVDGERIELSPVASTMMACPEGMDTEQALVDTLERATSWGIVGEHLELFDADGGRLAGFERRLMP
jgi:copper homeostasis protein (lipoprotein)